MKQFFVIFSSHVTLVHMDSVMRHSPTGQRGQGVHRHRLRLMYDMPWPMVQSEGQLADMQTIPVPPQRTGRPPGLLENAKWHRKLKHAYGGTNRVAGGSCAHTHTLDEY